MVGVRVGVLDGIGVSDGKIFWSLQQGITGMYGSLPPPLSSKIKLSKMYIVILSVSGIVLPPSLSNSWKSP